MKSSRYFYILPFFLLLLLSACDKDPEVPNEEELITTLIYTLTPTSGGDPVVFSFRDIDGDGGQAPVVVTGNLAANTMYNGVIQLRNESVSPVDDITIEVEEEAEEHQFFYIFSDVNATSAYADVDAENNPIGIRTSLTAGDPGEGLMTILLRHLPDKFADGVREGDVSNAGGETDIEVSFTLTIE